ncbi:Lrp/AsnC family transcriptional regulator [Streptomyces sp. WI04-05B]|uniref:Lrp/AsnC family transcriptional regulator n=1 Tax=Streptomyces TaxID=1883 RepID=UPI0029B1D5B2|nr:MULTISPECIES: Lrp/AsnC family transcriptional regulator [unclassified Streptomyces]MDX2545391.1 Lrp/AsnC family transcriptional regulator [Streptomyces sp. WI04-05B]MDX2588114.1 Lrp/AsnC family transcriptional regulator [Streptomyces sp. WI04-05A]MDX3749125.1 Lrp/AsnC family transcriptional regulator [Streptomyces sp. AK08-02]
MAARIELDAVDRALIRHLQQDGRASYTDLGKEVGLSGPAVRARVQRLTESGLLQFAAVTDPMRLGLPVMALLGVKVDGELQGIIDRLETIDSVIYLVTTAGAFDLFVEVVCRTMPDLSALINEDIRVVPGVREVQSFPYFGIHVHRFTWDIPD